MGVQRAVGLMSGTSMDGIDVAIIETDGERVARFGPSALHFYRDDEEVLLRRAMSEARELDDRTDRRGILAEAERMVTALHAAAVEVFLETNGIDRQSIDVVGFHGQTVLHRPAQKLTVQLGDGAALAGELGLPVVFDFRAADLAAGGQGAPLVPVYHAALARELDRPRPLAVLNVGGVANVTYLDGTGEPIACDTGPGNALLDDFMRARTGEDWDADGKTAAQGMVHETLIEQMLDRDFFARSLPKSLDRNDFSLEGVERLSLADGAATLTALTAAAAARIVPHLPSAPKFWIVAGGGARNQTLMRMLEERLAPAAVASADAVGWSVEALEAQAFAFLAVRSLKGLPITFPGTTGVPLPMTGGVLAVPHSLRSIA